MRRSSPAGLPLLLCLVLALGSTAQVLNGEYADQRAKGAWRDAEQAGDLASEAAAVTAELTVHLPLLQTQPTRLRFQISGFPAAGLSPVMIPPLAAPSGQVIQLDDQERRHAYITWLHRAQRAF